MHGGIYFRVRSLTLGGWPQFSLPQAHADDGKGLSGCHLFSFVAWGRVCWPGNDFFGGSRCTADRVKASATDSMAKLTGCYFADGNTYLPPQPHATWGQLVREQGITLP